MQSKLLFDLDYDNNPIITIQERSSDDLRDKVAQRFIQRVNQGKIQICVIEYQGSSNLGNDFIIKRIPNFFLDEVDLHEAADTGIVISKNILKDVVTEFNKYFESTETPEKLGVLMENLKYFYDESFRGECPTNEGITKAYHS